MGKLYEKLHELDTRLTVTHAAIDKLIAKACPEHKEDARLGFLTYSLTWECPDSPLEACIYHRLNDSAQDCCLYCGQPRERK